MVSSLFDFGPALRPDHGPVWKARADQVKTGPAGPPRSGLVLS